MTNARALQVAELKKRGLNGREIGDLLGYTRSHINSLVRRPAPRYIKGHYKPGKGFHRTCAHCCRVFKAMGQLQRFCQDRECQLAGWPLAVETGAIVVGVPSLKHERAIRERDYQRSTAAYLRDCERRQRAAVRAIFAQARIHVWERQAYNRHLARSFDRRTRREWEQFRLAARDAMRRERAAEREFRLAARDVEGRWEVRALWAWRDALEEAREIVKLQRRGQRAVDSAVRLNDRMWRETKPQRISLDTAGAGDHGHDWILHERSYELDPARMLEEDVLAGILGDLSVEDIPRLREDEIRVLRERLIAEGFAPRGTRPDLHLVGEPLRHRGEAPAPSKTRMAPRHRGRNAQKALMAGKRTSRKPKKRWERAA